MNPNLPTGETMSEGSEFPPLDNPAPVLPPTLEQCVPLEALSQPDDADQLTQPEIGDAVDYAVTGKVTRIEGDMAYVMPETVNGKDVKPAAASQGASAAGGDTFESLQAAAQGMQ